MKLKTGDKVRLIGDPASHRDKRAWYGEVVTINNVYNGSSYPYTIKEHPGFCWRDTELELVETKIVITTDNVKVVTAKMYVDGKVVKTAEAKCAPEDTFDFTVGAKLACDRLTKKEAPKPTYYNGKVVCINAARATGNSFIVGKVYNIVDGKFIDENGNKRPMTIDVVASVGDLKNKKYFKDWAYQFIPFVEG